VKRNRDASNDKSIRIKTVFLSLLRERHILRVVAAHPANICKIRPFVVKVQLQMDEWSSGGGGGGMVGAPK